MNTNWHKSCQGDHQSTLIDLHPWQNPLSSSERCLDKLFDQVTHFPSNHHTTCTGNAGTTYPKKRKPSEYRIGLGHAGRVPCICTQFEPIVIPCDIQCILWIWSVTGSIVGILLGASRFVRGTLEFSWFCLPSIPQRIWIRMCLTMIWKHVSNERAWINMFTGFYWNRSHRQSQPSDKTRYINLYIAQI